MSGSKVIRMRFEEKDSGWRRIEEERKIDLGDYQVIKEPGDWKRGAEKALNTILERIGASKEVEKRAKKLMERVYRNQDKFSGKSRLTIATAIAYFAADGDIGTREMTKAGTISPASLKNTIEMMSNTIDLN